VTDPASPTSTADALRTRALALQGVLRGLPAFVRLGVACVMLTMLLGLAASGMVIQFHYQNRDESPGLTLDDLRAGFHGITAEAPLLVAVKRNHPDNLPGAQREVLLKWLGADRVAENYDNIDLGAMSPGEVISTSCVSCHSRKADRKDPKVGSAPDWPLEFKDDAVKLAVSRKVEPRALAKLADSTHLHAPAMATMAIMLGGLLWITRLPRPLVSLLCLAMGLGLALDIGSWWAARSVEALVPVIAIAGAVFNGSCALAMLLVTLDALWPARRR
jgi:hypothetical protein